ncbi:hypothetical protein ACFLXT_01330 [Chloroflexota bacterium]
MTGKEGKKPVLVPKEIYDTMDERVKVTGLDSVDRYITFVLEEVLKDDGEGIPAGNSWEKLSCWKAH